MKNSLLAVLVAGGLFSSAFMAPAVLAAEVDFPHIETMGVSQIQVEPDMADVNVEVAVTEKPLKLPRIIPMPPWLSLSPVSPQRV